MKRFGEYLRKHAIKIMKNEIINKQYENTKIFYIGREKLEDKYAKDKNYRKVGDHFHYTGEYRSAAHGIFILKNNINKKISTFFSYWI